MTTQTDDKAISEMNPAQSLDGIRENFAGLNQDMDEMLAARPLIEEILSKLTPDQTIHFIEGTKEIDAQLESFKAKITQVQEMMRGFAK